MRALPLLLSLKKGKNKIIIIIINDNKSNTDMLQTHREKILDQLSTPDILRMGKTCKRMEEVCGYYVSRYLRNVGFHEYKRNINLTRSSMYLSIRKSFFINTSVSCIWVNGLFRMRKKKTNLI